MGKYVFKEHRVTVPYKILVCSIQSGDKNTVTMEQKEGGSPGRSGMWTRCCMGKRGVCEEQAGREPVTGTQISYKNTADNHAR